MIDNGVVILCCIVVGWLTQLQEYIPPAILFETTDSPLPQRRSDRVKKVTN